MGAAARRFKTGANQGDDRNAALQPFHVPQELKAISVMKGEIQNCSVRTKTIELPTCVSERAGLSELMAVRQQKSTNTGTNDGIRIYNQDLGLAQAFTCFGQERLLEGLGYEPCIRCAPGINLPLPDATFSWHPL